MYRGGEGAKKRGYDGVKRDKMIYILAGSLVVVAFCFLHSQSTSLLTFASTKELSTHNTHTHTDVHMGAPLGGVDCGGGKNLTHIILNDTKVERRRELQASIIYLTTLTRNVQARRTLPLQF